MTYRHNLIVASIIFTNIELVSKQMVQVKYERHHLPSGSNDLLSYFSEQEGNC